MSETSIKHKAEAPEKLKVAILTCSDSKYENLKKGEKINDVSGDLIEELIKKAGYKVHQRILLPDNLVLIKEKVKELLYLKDVDAIIITGGTGISHKDVTIEAVNELIEKALPGFGELFRKLSYEKIGSAAILTRALAGVAKSKAIFCLPGSPNAVNLAVSSLIIPELTHIIKHAKE
ncbi:MAG: MogA/MoaB family molybdenum cofactor biosynthesis protein [Candidatus Bathyarchaeia archaeon]